MSIKRIKDFPNGSGSLSNDDVFLFMDDPSGSGVTKKISLNDMSVVRSDTTTISGAVKITNIVLISQSDYNNLSTYDSNTLYIIS